MPTDPAATTEAPQGPPALRVVAMPRDTNPYGAIFGGVILSYIDQAGFVEARTHGAHRWVTVAVDRVEFHAPVFVGDIITCRTRTLKTGTSSVTVEVCVEAERYMKGETVHVTSAAITLVSVDAQGKPIPFSSPPSVDARA